MKVAEIDDLLEVLWQQIAKPIDYIVELTYSEFGDFVSELLRETTEVVHSNMCDSDIENFAEVIRPENIINGLYHEYIEKG